jgi:hypothetical protein
MVNYELTFKEYQVRLAEFDEFTEWLCNQRGKNEKEFLQS